MHLRQSHLKAPRGRRRFGSRRAKDPAARIGQGAAWLVHDAARDCYHCYWLVGPSTDHLVERAIQPSAADAVDWARCRTSRARIRLADHRTYWAGTHPSPPGFAGIWAPASQPTALLPQPLLAETGSVPPAEAA